MSFSINIFLCLFRTDVEELAVVIAQDEPLITQNVLSQLVESLEKLQKKIYDSSVHHYNKSLKLKAHLLPLTNVAFDRQGKM